MPKPCGGLGNGRAQAGLVGDTGRVLLRPSGTESLVRVMVEAATYDEAYFLSALLNSTIVSLTTVALTLLAFPPILVALILLALTGRRDLPPGFSVV